MNTNLKTQTSKLKAHNIGLKVLFLSFSFCLLSFIFSFPVNAQESPDYTIANPSITVTLQEDNTVKINQQFTLANISQTGQVLSGYKLVIPFPAIQNPQVTIGGKAMNFTTSESKILGITELQIRIDPPLLSSQGHTIDVLYYLPNYIIQNDKTRFFLFGNSTVSDTQKYENITLMVPESFGSLELTSLQTIPEGVAVDSFIKYELEKPNNVFYMLWGKEYTLHFSQQSQFQNITDKPIHSLYQIIPAINGQSPSYVTNITNADYGIKDIYNNVFAAISLDPGVTKVGGYDVQIHRNYKNIDNINFSELPFELSDGALQNKLRSFIDMNDIQKSFDTVYDYLIESYKAASITTDFSTNEQFWKRINTSNELSSFEFCGILSAVAKDLQIQHSIRYGYMSFYPQIANDRTPHFWCVFNINNTNVLYDPFLEGAVGINFQAQKTEFDRIYVGTWHPDIIPYSSALGMTADQTEIQQINILEPLMNALEQSNVDFNLKVNDTVYAGLFFSAEIEVVNNTPFVLPLANVDYNNITVTNSVKDIMPSTTWLALPHQKSHVIIDYLREPNFLLTGEREILMTLDFQNDNFPSVTKELRINFSAYIIAIALGFGIVVTVLGLLVGLVYFIYRQRNYAILQR